MKCAHVIDWTKMDPKKDLIYKKPGPKNDHGGYSVPLLAKDETGEHKFVHVTPRLRMPFGINDGKKKKDKGLSIGLSFPGVRAKNKRTTPDEISAPFDVLKEEWECDNVVPLNYMKFIALIDQTNMDTVCEKSTEWFGLMQRFTPEVVSQFYFHSLWNSEGARKGEYPPIFNVKIPCKVKDDINTTSMVVYNQRKERVDPESLVGDGGKGLDCVAVLEATSLWFAGKSFGISYRVVQLMVSQRADYTELLIDPAILGGPSLEDKTEDEQDAPPDYFGFGDLPEAKRAKIEDHA